MFDGVDEVPWGRLGYDSRGGGRVGDLLREIVAARPGKGDDSPVWRLRHGLFVTHVPDEVCGAAPCLVPYLIEGARGARQPHRGLLLDLLTDMARSAPYRDVLRDAAAGPEPDHVALAREAMVAHADALVGFLDDVARKVVVAAARLLACLPEAAPTVLPALRARAEKGARVKIRARGAKGQRSADGPGPMTADAGAVACVLAVAWLAAGDHVEWFSGLAGAEDAHRDVRAAAAAGLALAEPAAPPASEAAITLMADAEADPATTLQHTRIRWHGDAVTPLGTALIQAEHWQRALVRQLLARPGHRETDQALYLAGEAIASWRASAVELLPALAGKVRELRSVAPPHRRRIGQEQPLVHAVRVISQAGQAAAPQADLMAEMLTGDPAGPWPEVAAPAVQTLAVLGDGRCVPWLAAAFRHGFGRLRDLDVLEAIPAMAAHADALMPALTHFLGPASRGSGGFEHLECMNALVSWREAAAPLLQPIADRLTTTYLASAFPLFAALGPAAAEVVPRVRAVLGDEAHRHEAAWTLWRITGETGEAPALLTRHLARYGGHSAGDVAPLLEEFGPAAEEAVPVLRALYHDEFADRFDRVAIARALWAITGEPDGLVAPLRDAITTRPLPGDGWWRGAASALRAVEGLGMMGPAAAEAVPALEVIANGRARVTRRDVPADERYQRAARQALALIRA
ncbi:hypothetical protein [Nonomuraea rhodomycinica]|uniref:HEAT repeat-containing protein n=1 Tax=Nonomuraea rhodomycinica TaxID=1712872 RepID=A0A7Y6IU36_9ACTN|nr:hypothetical protein [Nonomuraea rhodomycinica]NUW43089.1 hypothetical protein [Nonomuraea rhodomycinica]